MSGFHLDVQCSDRYKGFRGSYTLPGRFSVYVSEGICKRNKRQRFPFGSVMGQGPFQVSHLMQYVLRLTPCTPSFRVSRAYEGQTVSGPGVASFHLKLRGGKWATCSVAHFFNSSNLYGCSCTPSVPIRDLVEPTRGAEECTEWRSHG